MPFLKIPQKTPPPVPKHTYGNAVPNNGRRGCLSPDGTTYGRQYCKRYLINQGIGITESVPVAYTRSFNRAFSNGFQ